MLGSRKTLSVAAFSSACGAIFIVAQSAGQAEPILKSVQERAAKYAISDGRERSTQQGRFALCVESWDAATHMSKQDWRSACQRSVRDYPDAFR
jgi:hypothetical protein